jgi:hypothetical protein
MLDSGGQVHRALRERSTGYFYFLGFCHLGEPMYGRSDITLPTDERSSVRAHAVEFSKTVCAASDGDSVLGAPGD